MSLEMSDHLAKLHQSASLFDPQMEEDARIGKLLLDNNEFSPANFTFVKVENREGFDWEPSAQEEWKKNHAVMEGSINPHKLKKDEDFLFVASLFDVKDGVDVERLRMVDQSLQLAAMEIRPRTDSRLAYVPPQGQSQYQPQSQQQVQPQPQQQQEIRQQQFQYQDPPSAPVGRTSPAAIRIKEMTQNVAANLEHGVKKSFHASMSVGESFVAFINRGNVVDLA
ncbi:UNVERIFIED_CONTAM: hypothetical protein HDU68_012475, partial [Siphonaria sp. JEL0065]